jgi:hypothetical protein
LVGGSKSATTSRASRGSTASSIRARRATTCRSRAGWSCVLSGGVASKKAEGRWQMKGGLCHLLSAICLLQFGVVCGGFTSPLVEAYIRTVCLTRRLFHFCCSERTR